MVVIPFSAYNTHSTTKKFPKEYYDCIKKGSAAKTTIKADHVFFDSLLNLPVKPKKEAMGYIRIPFEGNGQYGVRFHYGHNKHSITWYFKTSPTDQPLPLNKEFMPHKKHLSQNVQKKKNVYSNTLNTKKKRRSTTRKKSLRIIRLNHKEKQNKEWNDATAKELQKELKQLREEKPDWTDRFALK